MRLVPYFLDAFPAARRPSFPIVRGSREVDVAIVGGGLTGCACAWAFAAAGVRVALLESGRIGAGATAGSTGLARQDLRGSFVDASAAHGVRTARHLWQAARRSSMEFIAALKRAGVKGDAAAQDILWCASGDRAAGLQREYRARKAAGLDARWLTAKAFAAASGATASGAMRIKADAIDPHRACMGLASAAAGRGAQIFERSAVTRIEAGSKRVTLNAGAATLSAAAVIIATGNLPEDVGALRRHFSSRQTCGVVTAALPSAVRRELGSHGAALEDTMSPPHLLRWLKDDRVLFSGAEQPAAPARLRDKQLVARANELMYELTTIYPAISGVAPAWAWETIHHRSPDGLPVVGPHRNFPRHLFALGLGLHGPGAAWLSARLLLRAYRGEPEKGDDTFGFARVL